MRTIRTSTGADLPVDGDLLAVLETLYREVTARRGLDRTFEDMMREIHHLIDQMTAEEQRAYLVESLFLNTVTYENERLGAYLASITKAAGTPVRAGKRSDAKPKRRPAPGRAGTGARRAARGRSARRRR